MDMMRTRSATVPHYTLPRLTARDLMTNVPVFVEARAPLSQAADVLAALGAHHLPVMQDGKVVGLVTSADLFEALQTAEAGEPVLHAVKGPAIVVAPEATLPQFSVRSL